MANADGSVIFSCDLDSTKAQKKLSKLRDKISELNSELEKETGNKMNLEKQLDAASQAAKATEERVKMLRKEVERLNDREWIQKQGFTQYEYQTQVLDRRAAAQAELKQQEELLHTQTKEVKTLSAAYEETTANIDSMTVKLDKAKVAAGELIANTEQERREREAENSALAKAGQYAARFRDQVKSLARSMLVFSVITAALMALRKQIKAAIATSAEASDAFARPKGALLTLAAPLMDVLIPALTWLMNLLAAIVSEIVTIISILSGKSKKSMEASGKNLYKAAAAIDATGKAAKEATDALAAFDEINKLSTTTSVGGGGGGASVIAPDFDFNEGPMMEKLDKVFRAEGFERFDENRRLDCHVERAAYPHAVERLFGRVLFADCDKPRHFVFGDVELFSAPRREVDVCYFIFLFFHKFCKILRLACHLAQKFPQIR